MFRLPLKLVIGLYQYPPTFLNAHVHSRKLLHVSYRAANAKEETTGRTGALGFLICVLSPIDDFGEKNIMRLFVLFLD